MRGDMAMSDKHVEEILDMVKSKDITVEDATKLINSIKADSGYTINYPVYERTPWREVNYPFWMSNQTTLTTSGDLMASGTLTLSGS